MRASGLICKVGIPHPHHQPEDGLAEEEAATDEVTYANVDSIIIMSSLITHVYVRVLANLFTRGGQRRTWKAKEFRQGIRNGSSRAG